MEVTKRVANGSMDLIASLESSVPQLDERIANARLIAAAPDLLSACEATLEDLSSEHDSDDWRDAARDQLRSAIARAKGG